MDFRLLERVLRSHNSNYRRINSSPLSVPVFGDTLVFVLEEDANLPKSVGFISSTATEIAFILTTEALSLYREHPEAYIYSILAEINTEISRYCVWFHAKKDSKFQFHCRGTLVNSADITEEEVWRMLGEVREEYLRGGTRLKDKLLHPQLEKLEPFRETERRRIVRSWTEQACERDKVGDNCFRIRKNYLKETESDIEVEGTVKIYEQHVTFSVNLNWSSREQQDSSLTPLCEPKVKSHREKMTAALNSIAKSRLGVLSYSPRDSSFAYKLNYVYEFEDSDRLAEALDKALQACVRKARHREGIFNERSIKSMEIEVEEESSDSISPKFPLQDDIYMQQESQEKQNVVKFWLKNSPHLTEVEKDVRYRVGNLVRPICEVKSPNGLHIHCLISEFLLNRNSEEFVACEASDPSSRYNLAPSTLPFDHPSQQLVYRTILPELQQDLAKIAFPSDISQPAILSTSKKSSIKVTVRPLVASQESLWEVCKQLFRVSITVIFAENLLAKLHGFALQDRTSCILAVEEWFPSVATHVFAEDYRSGVLSFLRRLASDLIWLHQREVWHLHLCPATVRISGAQHPKLTDAQICPLCLPPLPDAADITSLHFFAPEVLQLMAEKRTYYSRNLRHYSNICSRADSYSFAMLLHWFLVLNRPPQYPVLCRDPQELVLKVRKEKVRPVIPERFEESEPILTDLMYRCWGQTRHRPEMQEILELLQRSKSERLRVRPAARGNPVDFQPLH